MYVLLCSVTQLCPTLYNSMGWSLPGSPVHGIFQARKRVGCQCFSRGSSQFGDRTGVSCVSCTGRQILYHQYYLQVGISEMIVFWRKLQNNPELHSDSIGFPCLAPAQAATPLLLSKRYYISWDLQESSGEAGRRASRIRLHWTPFNRSAERTAPARKPNTQPCLNLDSRAIAGRDRDKVSKLTIWLFKGSGGWQGNVPQVFHF